MSKQADEDLNLEVVEYPEGTRFIGPGDDVVISAAVLKANYTPNSVVEQRCLEAEKIGKAKMLEQTLMWPPMAFDMPGTQIELLDQPISKKLARALHEEAKKYRDELLTNLQNKEEK